jgi:signal transduction histidine kinase
MPFPEFLNRQPKWLIIFAGMGMVALIGSADYATGWDWSFSLLYAVPIMAVTWSLGGRVGFCLALLCAATFWIANTGRNPFKTDWGFGLAVATRLFYFEIFVLAVAMFRTRSKLDRIRIAQLEQMRELELQILRASEREQQRIGRDLHDSLAPHLTAVSYAVNFLVEDLRRQQRPEAAKAELIHQLLGEAVTLTRKLARGLSFIQSDAEGLVTALEDLARTTSRLTGIPVSFHETGVTRTIEPESVLHLHRIAQEAVNNAVKHGDAKNISLILDKGEQAWHLTVADDGKGMAVDPDELRGMGLLSMRYRARAMGGELKIDSKPGEGTIVSCEVPCHSKTAYEYLQHE